MEVMSVGDSGIGISQTGQKFHEFLVHSPQDDSVFSSTSVMEGEHTDGQETSVSVLDAELSQMKDTSKHQDGPQANSGVLDSELSESKHHEYGLYAGGQGDKIPSNLKGKMVFRNLDASMYLPKIPDINPASPCKDRKPKLKISKKIPPAYPKLKQEEDPDFDVNPEAVPFLPSNFMSSTVLKKIAVPKRHLDTFGGMEYNLTGRRGVILHTDRYNWTSFRPIEGMSQRDRLLAELSYMEKLRGVKRRIEVLPHRAQLDLFMGGKKIEMEERFDITREIQKLKSLVLPQHARELYHGRGIVLPVNHSSIKPRGEPYNITEELSASAPASVHQHYTSYLDLLGYNRSQGSVFSSSTTTKKRGQLPSLNRNRASHEESYPGTMKPRHTVLPSVDATAVSRSPAAWVADQNRRIIEGHGRVEVTVPNAGESKSRLQESDMEVDKGDNQAPFASPAGPPPTAGNRTMTSAGATDPTAGERQSTLSIKPHPLKGEELSVPDIERSKLLETFQRLDTDMDGHLNYNQVRSQLPETFSQMQESFVKQVYDIISSGSMFGVEDFMNMTKLTEAVDNLGENAKLAFQDLQTDSLESTIKKFVELFQSVDRSNRGKMSADSLKEILSAGLDMDFTGDVWTKVTDTMGIGAIFQS